MQMSPFLKTGLEKQDYCPAGDICCLNRNPTFIKPLDASGGGVFRIITGPAMLD
jgi:hypothetical protein